MAAIGIGAAGWVVGLVPTVRTRTSIQWDEPPVTAKNVYPQ